MNKYFIAKSSDGSVSEGFYMTSSKISTDTPGPLFRLKTGTDSATPSTNGVIAQNLLRLSSLLEDDSYKALAKETCSAFSVEVLQHPFLFVGLLDAIVGLELGVKNVTGVLGSSEGSTSGEKNVESRLIQRLRDEAGATASTSAATLSLVDVRSTNGDRATENKTQWLRKRNPLFKDLHAGKNFILSCEAGQCRTIDDVPG